MIHRVEPIVLSVSRATDIPAFYSDWFIEKWRIGSAPWTNPFNRNQQQVVDFAKVRAIVFWSKNPAPLFHFLPELDNNSLSYYFNFTLNDYEGLSIETAVPPINQRIETFISLSERLGAHRMCWRFDPLLKCPNLGIDSLLSRIIALGDKLIPYTNKLIFSFIRVREYKKVQRQLLGSGIFDKTTLFDAELTDKERALVIETLSREQTRWRKINPHFSIVSCAESDNYEDFGIAPNRCIDDRLLAEIGRNDAMLLQHLGYEKDLFGNISPINNINRKHIGQRKTCNCFPSKDIGWYGSCPHGCIYCYAQ